MSLTCSFSDADCRPVLWRPIRIVAERLTARDLLSTNSALVLSCRSCGSETPISRAELDRLAERAATLSAIEAEAICPTCGAQGMTAFFGAERSRRFRRRRSPTPTIVARTRQVGVVTLATINALAMIFLFRVAEAAGATSPLGEAAAVAHWHFAAALATLAACVPSFEQGAIQALADRHVGDMTAFAALLALVCLRPKDIGRADRCFRRTLIDLVSGPHDGDGAKPRRRIPEGASWIGPIAAAAMSLSVYLVVFDTMVLQSAVVIAMFFFPKASRNRQDRLERDRDRVAGLSRFMLNKVGPLVFAEGALIFLGALVFQRIGVL
ncbi:MAG: hypothetical protein GC152_14585 [Alphaproteobacteria bacterium]|nr:hypothetical protein [Alphaproteobacteria bacterium]